MNDQITSSPIQFSVVVPLYNAQKTIIDCLNSIQNQSYLPQEIILVDDCSTDESVKLVEKWKEEQLTKKIDLILIKQTKNQGPAAARNQGILQAKGNYVAFIDSDDYWHYQKLEIIERMISKNQKKILVIGHSYDVFNPLIKLSNHLTIKIDLDKSIQSIKKFNEYALLISNRVCPSSYIVESSLLKKSLFDTEMRFSEDYQQVLKLVKQHTLFCLPFPLTILSRPFLSPGGLSSHRFSMRLGEMKVYYQWGIDKKRPQRIFMIPILILFSFLKFIRQEIRIYLGKYKLKDY